MRWLKAREAAAYAGNISTKILYRAARTGTLRVARIGAGRNVLFSTVWLDEWLCRCAEPDDPRKGDSM